MINVGLDDNYVSFLFILQNWQKRNKPVNAMTLNFGVNIYFLFLFFFPMENKGKVNRSTSGTLWKN